jgi:hypothetical protein
MIATTETPNATTDAQTATHWRTTPNALAHFEALTPREQRDVRAALARHDLRAELERPWKAHGTTLAVGDSPVFVIAQGNVFTVKAVNSDLGLGTDGCWYDRVPQNLRWFPTRERVEETLLALVRHCVN